MLACDRVKLYDAAVFDVLYGDGFCRSEVGVSALPWLVKALNGLAGSVHGSLQCVLWHFARGGKTMALEFCQILVEFFRITDCISFALDHAGYPCRKFCLQIGLLPWSLDEDVEYPINFGVLSVVFFSLDGKSHCWIGAFVAHQRQYVRVVCINRD